VDGGLVEPLPELSGGVRSPAVCPREDGGLRAPPPGDAEDAVTKRAQSNSDDLYYPLAGATERLVYRCEDQLAELVGVLRGLAVAGRRERVQRAYAAFLRERARALVKAASHRG
jgi:hypothetical protein